MDGTPPQPTELEDWMIAARVLLDRHQSDPTTFAAPEQIEAFLARGHELFLAQGQGRELDIHGTHPKTEKNRSKKVTLKRTPRRTYRKRTERGTRGGGNKKRKARSRRKYTRASEKRWKSLGFYNCREALWKNAQKLGGKKQVWQLIQADDTDFPSFYPSQKGWTFERIHSWINDKHRGGLSGQMTVSERQLRYALQLCKRHTL